MGRIKIISVKMEAIRMKSKIARITWDMNKCKIPLVCKICLECCQEQVFQLLPTGLERGIEYPISDPGRYIINPEWLDRCIGCNECIEKCPNDALKIEFPEVEIKSQKKAKKEINLDKPDFVLDFRECIGEQKKYFELGAMTDKLKKHEVLHIIDENNLSWIEKRLRMIRPGRFVFIGSKVEKDDVYKLIIHRTMVTDIVKAV